MKLNLPYYQIFLDTNIIDNLDGYIYQYYKNKDIFIITDDNVFSLYQELISSKLKNFNLKWLSIKPGEQSKSFTTYLDIINQLIESKIKRDNLIIALGGGVVGDLAGFVAATLYRGIKFIQIPTTLLAQVDSSIGSKVGINLAEGKNLIGSFYHPKTVLIDPLFLETLPIEEYNNGIAEMIKCGLIGDKKLYQYLLENSKVSIDQIYAALKVKQRLVVKDPYEQYERMMLNFGHTFGHAIEKRSNYTIKHGSAISYGMLIALKIGIKQGISPNIYDEVKQMLLKFNLVTNDEIDYHKYLDDLNFDKKNLSKGLQFIFISKIGQGYITKLDVTKL